MREPLAYKPEPRTHSRVEVEGPDEGTSQRYLALAALKAPQNLPQPNLREEIGGRAEAQDASNAALLTEKHGQRALVQYNAGALAKSIDSSLNGDSTRPFPAYSIPRARMLLLAALPDAAAKP